MSRQKGTPNKSKEPMTRGQVATERTPAPKEENKELLPYWIISHTNIFEFENDVIAYINSGYRCSGGIAIHDIRNPLTNEYEPHFYQAMERME